MAAIFVSYASQDAELVNTLKTWLEKEGFDDLFIAASSIRAGDHWTEALRNAKGSCRIVLCVVTPSWLSSDECIGEFTAGWYAGRRILPLFCVAGASLDVTDS